MIVDSASPRVLQINAVYELYSTGRTTRELHEELRARGLMSEVACALVPKKIKNKGVIKLGNQFDHKVHGLISRITGHQGNYSRFATEKLIKYIEETNFNIVHLRNLHSNYINLPYLLDFLEKKDIATVLTLHDCWFYTGKCTYYIEDGCERWRTGCGQCKTNRTGNPSLFFDRSAQNLKEKATLFSRIRRLGVVGVSDWITKDAAESILGGAALIKRIYNWIDLETFSPHKSVGLQSKLGLDNRFVILGVAANWSDSKGLGVFRKLASALPDDYAVVLVGDLAGEKVPPNLIAVGPVSSLAELADYYRMADVFVNPSVQETFGKTTAEAMSCGTPVVAYDGTATPELIGRDGSCGLLVESNRAEDYLKAIDLLKSVDCRKRMGDLARRRAEMLFAMKAGVDQYVDVYKELLQL